MRTLTPARKRPSASLIISIIALIASLTGTAFATGVLPANSVGARQLKKSAVTTIKIAPSAVTSAKVKNGSLLAADFKTGQLPAGAKGDKGDPGTNGTNGAAGTARAHAVVTPGASPSFSPNSLKGFTAVTNFGTGTYCLTPAAGISPTTNPAVVSVEWDSTSSPEGNTTAVWQSQPIGCAAGDYKVRTYRRASGASTDNALSDTVAFSIIVA